jgi:hypothetical protein
MAEKKKPAKKQEPKDEPKAQAQETESVSDGVVTYIVNGQRVDANGNPVKGGK